MINLMHDREADARALMERVQRDGRSLEAEYPLVFGEGFDGRALALGNDGQVESACALLTREFRMGEHSVRGGMIGCVSTDPEHRGKGLATRILVEAEAALQVDGCAFVLLWGEDPSFYLKRGFCPTGVEYDFVVSAEEAQRLPQSDGVRTFVADDLPTLHALYAAHATRVDRSLDEMHALFSCQGMKTLVLERDGAVVSYACRGRGADFADSIHEWAGEADDVLALVRTHVEQAARDEQIPGLVVMAPETATDLRTAFAVHEIQQYAGILGLGKVLDRPTVTALVDACLGEYGHCELISTAEGERFRISGPKDTGEIDDNGILALIFPTIELRPAVEEFLSRFGLQDTALPLTPFVWGLDSI